MSCPLCESDQRILVQQELRYAYDGAVYRCEACDLVYLWPPMTPAEEKRFYEEEYGVIFAAEKGLTPEQLFQKQLPAARTYLEWCRDRLKPTDRCLEIGCASGYFLQTLEPHVGSVDGCESHKQLAAYTRDLGYSCHEDLADAAGPYDKVFLWFVFEHISRPGPFLELILDRLAPDGEIILIIPDLNDPLYKLYDIPAFHQFYFTPAHHFYYTPETLVAMCDKFGLNADIKSVQRYDFDNHMHWMAHGKPGGQGSMAADFSPEFYSHYRQELLDHGYADAIVASITRQHEG